MNTYWGGKTVRNGHVELLRFIFSIVILIYHTSGYFHNGKRILAGGYLAVEFFFLLSGVFLGKHLKQTKEIAKSEPIEKTVGESWKYLFRRCLAIYPVFVISTVIGLCVNYTAGTWKMFTLGGLIKRLPAEFLALQNYGFSVLSATGVMWYISAMFFAIWFLYPIARKWYDVYVKYIAVVLGVATIGLLLHNFKTLNVPNSYVNGIFNTGFLRAIAMMSLGLVINEICAFLETCTFPKGSRCLLAFMEIGLFLIFIRYMLIQGENRGITDGSAVIILLFAMLIACSGKTIWHDWLDCQAVRFLGRFSSVLFMNHYYWCCCMDAICQKMNMDFNTNQKFFMCLLFSVLTSIFVYWIEKKLHILIKTIKWERLR